MKKGTLSVRGLYELVLDRRRRVVLPHKVVPAIAELHTVFASLFEAIHSATSDPRWRDAASMVREASHALRDQHKRTVAANDDDYLPRGVFEGPRDMVRKGLAMVRRR